MPALREVWRGPISRIQIGSGVIRGEQYQRAQEVEQVKSISFVSLAEEVGECVSRRLSLTTVAKDRLGQIDATAVMPQ